MYHVRLAGGIVASELQLMFIFSPTEYLRIRMTGEGKITKDKSHRLSAPRIFGPSEGTTTTNMSPKALSVANMGPSSLTSHLYLPVLARVRWLRVTW